MRCAKHVWDDPHSTSFCCSQRGTLSWLTESSRGGTVHWCQPLLIDASPWSPHISICYHPTLFITSSFAPIYKMMVLSINCYIALQHIRNFDTCYWIYQKPDSISEIGTPIHHQPLNIISRQSNNDSCINYRRKEAGGCSTRDRWSTDHRPLSPIDRYPYAWYFVKNKFLNAVRRFGRPGRYYIGNSRVLL